jgi:lipid-binding SYLF domain-containing protein
MLKSKKLYIARALIFCVFIFIFCVGVNAKISNEEKERISNAVDVLTQLLDTPDKSIPKEIVNKCECMIVIPSVKKGAFVFGGQYGKGLATCRTSPSGWSAPIFFSLKGGSFGLQIGGQAIDLVLVVMNDKGVNSLLKNKFTLGADASVAAGPVGRATSAETDAALKAEILAYSRTQGLFAGISLKGSALKPDKEANLGLYGKQITAKEILVSNTVEVPQETAAFIDLLNKRTPNKD